MSECVSFHKSDTLLQLDGFETSGKVFVTESNLTDDFINWYEYICAFRNCANRFVVGSTFPNASDVCSA